MAKRTKAGCSRAEFEKKKALFVEAYVTNGGNGKQAAISAGYAKRSAEVTAVRLLKYVDVKAAIERRRAEVLAKAQEKTQLTADEVLLSLARDIRFDPAKLYNPDGSMKRLDQLDEDTRLALRGVEADEIAVGRGEERQVIGHTVKVKFPEKTAAREQGMKHFGLYELDNKQKPSPTVNVGVLSVPAEALNFEKVRARALKAA